MNGSQHLHWAQLDGLRCVAVLLVLLHHFWPELHPDLWHVGHLGVRLFFTLSGFLITSILLQGRAACDGDGGGGRLLGRFYARRALRLMPAFYLALGVALLLGIDGVRETLAWHALYASNLYFSLAGTWDPWVVDHFWSLAVEEQFYLVWPLVVLFAPRRLLLPLLLLTIAIGPLYRAAAFLGDWNDMAALTLPFAALDALGLGALLALVRDARPVLAGRLRLVAIGAVPASFLLPLLSEYATVLDAALGDLLAALGCLALIDGATSGRLGALGAVLARRVPAYLGRISYGIYLYHPLVKWLVFDGLDLWEDEPPEGGLAFLMLTSLSVGVAIVSWHAVEAPLVRLKRRLPYARPPAPALRAADERRAVPQAA